MSPSEFDLRAALHDGEGQPVDVDAVLTRGRAQRVRRRNRLLMSAAAGVLVVGVGTAVALVRGSDGTRTGSDSAARDSRAPTQRAEVSSQAPGLAAPTAYPGAGGPAPSAMKSTGATSSSTATATVAPELACPAAAPDLAAPAGGTAAGGPLFAAPVSTLVVCAYPGSGSVARAPANVVLSGRAARQLVSSLENASSEQSRQPCPTIARADARDLVLIGVTADHTRLAEVVTTLDEQPCAVRVTNGVAVRYGWSPPADLAPTLNHLMPGTSPHAMHGSPIHS